VIAPSPATKTLSREVPVTEPHPNFDSGTDLVQPETGIAIRHSNALVRRRLSSAGLMVVRHPVFDSRQRLETRAKAGQLLGGDHLRKLSVDLSHPGADRCGRRAPSLGQVDHHAAAVLLIDLARQVAAKHESIDELARRLLADPETPDHVSCGSTEVGHSPQDESPVSRQVVESGGSQSGRDGPRIAAACATHQCGQNDLVSGVLVSGAGLDHAGEGTVSGKGSQESRQSIRNGDFLNGTMSRVKARSNALLALDVVAVGLFVGIGRSVHDHGLSLDGLASTGWPFATGLVVGWLALAARQHSARSLTGGLTICVATVAVGMALRVVSGQGTAVAFVFVALGFLGLTMLGWRLIDQVTRRLARDRARPGRTGR
jgi:hypothetical protein